MLETTSVFSISFGCK